MADIYTLDERLHAAMVLEMPFLQGWQPILHHAPGTTTRLMLQAYDPQATVATVHDRPEDELTGIVRKRVSRAWLAGSWGTRPVSTDESLKLASLAVPGDLVAITEVIDPVPEGIRVVYRLRPVSEPLPSDRALEVQATARELCLRLGIGAAGQLQDPSARQLRDELDVVLGPQATVLDQMGEREETRLTADDLTDMSTARRSATRAVRTGLPPAPSDSKPRETSKPEPQAAPKESPAPDKPKPSKPKAASAPARAAGKKPPSTKSVAGSNGKRPSPEPSPRRPRPTKPAPSVPEPPQPHRWSDQELDDLFTVDEPEDRTPKARKVPEIETLETDEERRERQAAEEGMPGVTLGGSFNRNVPSFTVDRAELIQRAEAVLDSLPLLLLDRPDELREHERSIRTLLTELQAKKSSVADGIRRIEAVQTEIGYDEGPFADD